MIVVRKYCHIDETELDHEGTADAIRVSSGYGFLFYVGDKEEIEAGSGEQYRTIVLNNTQAKEIAEFILTEIANGQ